VRGVNRQKWSKADGGRYVLIPAQSDDDGGDPARLVVVESSLKHKRLICALLRSL